MHIQAVLFDMDGLMFDTEVVYGNAWRQAALAQGYSLSEEVLLKIKGAYKELVQQMLREDAGEGFDIEKARIFRREYVETFLKEAGVPQKKGLVNLLEYLQSKGIKISLATSTKRSLAQRYLEIADVEKYFDALTFGDEIEHGKPNPDIFLKAAKKVGVDIKNSLVLEDSINGIRGGVSAGAHVIMVPDTIMPNEELRTIVDKVVDDLDDVIIWIEEMNKE